MITYQTINPSSHLSSYVNCFYQVGGETGFSKEVPARLGATIIFDFHANTRIDGSTYKIAVLGQRQKPYSLETTAQNDRLVVQLSSYGLSAFCKFPICELNNAIINGDYILPKRIALLYEQLLHIRDTACRIILIEKFLTKYLIPPNETDQLIFNLANRIAFNGGSLSFDEIKASSNVCIRQLQRKFKAKTGLSMSTFNRVASFSKVLELLKREKEPRLTDIAFFSGYYDQSHFISEVKAFANHSPRHLTFC
jgi:AraC-like DNA-binding protein